MNKIQFSTKQCAKGRVMFMRYTAFVPRFQLDNTNYNKIEIKILNYIIPNFHIS